MGGTQKLSQLAADEPGAGPVAPTITDADYHQPTAAPPPPSGAAPAEGADVAAIAATSAGGFLDARGGGAAGVIPTATPAGFASAAGAAEHTSGDGGPLSSALTGDGVLSRRDGAGGITALTTGTLAAAVRSVRRDYLGAGAGDAERAVRMAVAATEVGAVAEALAEPAQGGGLTQGTAGRVPVLEERMQDAAAGAIKLARADLGCATWQLSGAQEHTAGQVPPQARHLSELSEVSFPPSSSQGGALNSQLDSLPGVRSALRTASEVEAYLEAQGGGGTAQDGGEVDHTPAGGLPEHQTPFTAPGVDPTSASQPGGTATQLTPIAAATVAAAQAAIAAAKAAKGSGGHRDTAAAQQVSLPSQRMSIQRPPMAPPPAPQGAATSHEALMHAGRGGPATQTEAPPPVGRSDNDARVTGQQHAAVTSSGGISQPGVAPSPWSPAQAAAAIAASMHHDSAHTAVPPAAVAQRSDDGVPVLSLSAFPAPSPMQQQHLLRAQLKPDGQLHSQEPAPGHGRDDGLPSSVPSLDLHLSCEPASLPPAMHEGREVAVAGGNNTQTTPPNIAPLVQAAGAGGVQELPPPTGVAGSVTRAVAAAVGIRGDPAGTAHRALAVVPHSQAAGLESAPEARDGDGGEDDNTIPATFPTPLALAMDTSQGTQGDHGAHVAVASQPPVQAGGHAVPGGTVLPLNGVSFGGGAPVAFLHPLAALFGASMASFPMQAYAMQSPPLGLAVGSERQPSSVPHVAGSSLDTGGGARDGSVPRSAARIPGVGVGGVDGRLSSPPLTSPPEDAEHMMMPPPSGGGGAGGSAWGTAEAELTARPAAWKKLSRLELDKAAQQARAAGFGGPGRSQTQSQPGLVQLHYQPLPAPPAAYAPALGAAPGVAAVAAAARARARMGGANASGRAETRAERLQVPQSRPFHNEEDPFAFPESQDQGGRRGGTTVVAATAPCGWRSTKRTQQLNDTGKAGGGQKTQAPRGTAPTSAKGRNPHGAGFAALATTAAALVQNGVAAAAPAAVGAVSPTVPRDAGLAAAVGDSDDEDGQDAIARPRGRKRGRGEQPAFTRIAAFPTAAAAVAAAVSPSSGVVIPRKRGRPRRQALVLDSGSDDGNVDKDDDDDDEYKVKPSRRGKVKTERGSGAAPTVTITTAGGDPDDETYVPSLPVHMTRTTGARSVKVEQPLAERRPQRVRNTSVRTAAGLEEGPTKNRDDGDAVPAKRARGAVTDSTPPPPRAPRVFDGMSFLTTGYSSGNSGPRVDLEQLLSLHGGTILLDVPPQEADVPLVIVVAASFVRTPKLLYSLAANKPLVKPAWIHACVAAGSLLPPPRLKSAKATGVAYEEHAFVEAPSLMLDHVPCLPGTTIVLAGAKSWVSSLAVVMRYAGARVIEIDTTGSGTPPQGGTGAAPRRVSGGAYDAPGLLPPGATIVSQAEKPPRGLLTAAAGAGCTLVRTEWAVQCLLQRACVPTESHLLPVAPITPGGGSAAVSPPGAVPAKIKKEEGKAAMPAQPVHSQVPRKAAEATASRRDSVPALGTGKPVATAVVDTRTRRGGAGGQVTPARRPARGEHKSPASSVHGAAGAAAMVTPGRLTRGAVAAAAVAVAGGVKRQRCTAPAPQVDLFEDEMDCAGCSTAFKKVRVVCGCSCCRTAFCMSGKDNCFTRHFRGEF